MASRKTLAAAPAADARVANGVQVEITEDTFVISSEKVKKGDRVTVSAAEAHHLIRIRKAKLVEG